MFARTRSLVAQVLALTSRAVCALEGILGALVTLNRSIEGALRDPAPNRPLLASIEGLSTALHDLAAVQVESGPARERLDALELSRVRWEAECEGLLLKADGKHNAAKAAEARERQLSKSYAKTIADPFPEDGNGQPSQGAVVLTDDVDPSEAESVSLMRARMASTPKSRALNAKWGVTE